MKYDLSVCLPGYRAKNWDAFFMSVERSIAPYNFELIIVGPTEPSENLKQKENVKYFKDFGSPARCLQIASTLAEGKYMTWSSDDGYFLPGSLAQCIQFFEEKMQRNDGMAIKYAEGTNFSGQCPPDVYFTAWHHDDLKLEGIPKDYNIAPVGMYNLEHFREMGGLDCRWEHANFNCIDLSFRIQNAG